MQATAVAHAATAARVATTGKAATGVKAAPRVAVRAAGASASSSFATGARLSAKASRTAARRAAVAAQAKIGDTLEEFLLEATPDPKLRQLMMSMSEAIRTIAYKVRTASCGGTACVNSFGDEQLAVDLLADKLLFEALKYSGCCKLACSEEVPEPLDLGGEGFSVAFDPLDGSSIVDTNFSVGTIFGVWPGDKLTGITGRQQAAAGMGIYGPRTVFCIALKDAPGCHEFLLQDDGKWLHVKETETIGEGKMFSPGNLRATFDNSAYEKLIAYYIGEKYTLRYTGGMVPDVFQIIVKEKGVFTNVISPSTKAKLRLLFEVAPLALLVEKAGGASSCDGLCVSGLDVEVKQHDQRTQICYGSKGEVRRFEEYMYGNSPRFSEVTA
ncbi:Sedoheptulose-1,7- chloroplastic [Chlorella sorokiniana]|jgi:sedoheptulose-bisphosphatase|uniref:Sedoheptulose-1,7-bisphosphatase, chloroplastic n=1 Tax=Chlorella sorokiniana TaxID=3076 RepID=A0A2P6TQI2_CHLSO|nr:Sedoheptulose-1,7- chloroplastic [Chlorella sorokiniana]|eukprot:PRW56262.1 Sedoheptulose-1,7- chloroplastic [Chlorella sorokiniana]